MSAPITLVKLGGSLITDKRRPETPRAATIRRLAREIAEGAAASGARLIVGHGSGSFGHVAAASTGIHRGLRSKAHLRGVSETQAAARRLHDRVVGALREAGASPFSFAPSSFLIGSGGRPARSFVDPILEALDRGLLPVVYGDVVLDRKQGVSIFSTEAVFEAVAAGASRRGRRVKFALWLGETPGVYDERGATIPRITPPGWARIRRHVGGSAGTDVTGGMVLRVATALRLTRRGVVSWVLDGREPGGLLAALRGEFAASTRIAAR